MAIIPITSPLSDFHEPMTIPTSLINQWIGNKLVLQIPIEETSCKSGSRKVLKWLAIAISTIGPYPYANISKKVSEGALGDTLVAGNWISSGSLGMWAYLDVIDSNLSTESAEEVSMREKMTTLKVSVKVISFLLGTAAQIPLAYLAAIYNPSNPGLNIFLTIAGEAGPTLKSIHSTIDEIRIRRSLTKEEKQLKLLKDTLKASIAENRSALIELGFEERTAYIQYLLDVGTLDVDDIDKIKQYIRLILSPIMPKRQALTNKGITYLATAGGAVFSAARLAMIAVTTFQATKYITESDAGCGFSAGIITAANAYLTIDVINKVANETVKRVVAACTCTFTPDLAMHLRPKLTVALKLLALGAASMSWGPLVEVGQTYFPASMATAMKITLSLGTVMLVANAMSSLVDDLVIASVRKWGTEDEKLFIKISDQMHSLISLIDRSPMLEFAKFAKSLPEEILGQALYELEMSVELLDDYIASKMPTIALTPLSLNSGPTTHLLTDGVV